MLVKFVTGLIIAFYFNNHVFANDDFQWPKQYKAAVSLSYDDALISQIDNVIPALDEHNLKASFYLTLASPVVNGQLNKWRDAAKNGHELGNHTLYHPCRGSLPNREWVSPQHDIDKKNIAQMLEEVTLANSFLKAIDGKDKRTFTTPCLDYKTKDGNYVTAIRPMFVAVKGYNPQLAEKFDRIYMPENVTGKQLISYVKKAEQEGGIANILFHGIGGDHLVVSKKAHTELLQFLADNQDKYWTDTYINIMQYVMDKQPIVEHFD